MKLKDKIVLVTGGFGLLGKEIVQFLGKEGAVVINADIAAETNDTLSEVKVDITNEESVQEMIALVLKKFGRIDGLVNNAYPRTKDWGAHFENIPLASWQKNIDMQLNTIFYLCQQIGAVMKEQKAGSIVNMSSIYGVVGPDFTVYGDTGMTMPAAYSAIKGGLVNFSRYLASYYGAYNIRVNCVSPGGIFDHQNTVFVKNYEAKVPMRRMGLPDDISGPVSFLLSEDSKYITGQNLIVDGGWTAI